MPLPYDTLSRLIQSRRALDTGELLEPNRALVNFNPDEAGLEWDPETGSYLNISRHRGVGTMRGGPYKVLGSVDAPESTADPSFQTPLAGQSLPSLRRLLQSKR